jgi:hypothetical protein
MIGLGRRVMSLAIAGLCLLGVLGAVCCGRERYGKTGGGVLVWKLRPVELGSCRDHFSATAVLGSTAATLEGSIRDEALTRESNSKLEGLNSKIRLINHRGYGHHSAAAIIAMIYLCCGGITVALPTGR